MEDIRLDELNDWRRTHYTTQISDSLDGEIVTLFGWVEEIRDLGGITFIQLRDREGRVQVTIPKKKVSPSVVEKVQRIGRQFPLGLRGLVKSSKEAPQGVEVVPKEIKVLGKAVYPLPIDPTGRVPANIDSRLDARLLDLRRPEHKAIFHIKHAITNGIRRYLLNKGFIEVQTPRIIGAAAEGGASLFPIQYFGSTAYLAQSPELYKEQLITVFEKVFEIGPYFRAEESHTRRHLNEFTSVDIEMAFATYDDVMTIHEDLVKYSIGDLSVSCEKDLKHIGVNLPKAKDFFKKYTYSQVIEELKVANVDIKWGEDIPTPAYRKLGKIHKREFYFIVDWPSKIRPFYIKPKMKDPVLCNAFDFMYEWIEITSGGTRVDDKEILITRLKDQNLNPKDFKFFLDAFDYGMPPHAGWGMGLDRLVMAFLNLKNIREAVLFPRDKFRLTP